MENKKELLQAIDEQTKKEDLDYYMFISNKGMCVNGSKTNILTLITSAIQALKMKGALNNRDIDKLAEILKLDKDGLFDEILKVAEKKDLKKMVNDLLKVMEEN